MGVQIALRERAILRGRGESGAFCCELCKKAEPIEMPFGIWTGLGKNVLNESAHWRNLMNTIDPYVCGDDATFLSNYSDRLFLVATESFQF